MLLEINGEITPDGAKGKTIPSCGCDCPENENSATLGTPGTDGAPAYPRTPGPRRVRDQFQSPRSPLQRQSQGTPGGLRGADLLPQQHPLSRGCRLWVRVRRPQGHIQAPDAKMPAGKGPNRERVNKKHSRSVNTNAEQKPTKEKTTGQAL